MSVRIQGNTPDVHVLIATLAIRHGCPWIDENPVQMSNQRATSAYFRIDRLDQNIFNQWVSLRYAVDGSKVYTQ
eukprot:3037096-Rhodomonas_salina.2